MSGNLGVLVDIVGQEDALKLARACPLLAGRRTLYVPVRLKNAEHLLKVLSADKLRLLHSRLAGCQITLGNPDTFERRKRAVEMLGNPTYSLSKIAAETGVSRNFLYRHWTSAA